MKFYIKHQIKGRLRIHFEQKEMTDKQADTALFYFYQLKYVTEVKVYERTADVVLCFVGEVTDLIKSINQFSYEETKVPSVVFETSSRALTAEYQEKIILKTLTFTLSKLVLPYPIKILVTVISSLKYLKATFSSIIRKKLEVSVLDGIAIAVSLLRGDFSTASSVMFMLGLGEILEEWTHKKSVEDLARSLSLKIANVWLKTNDKEILVKADSIVVGDEVVVHMGNVIPFDGLITQGEALVNQSTMTGEALPVRKTIDGYVYAGTVIEEGEIILKVKENSGAGKFEKIVAMIEESEKLKSTVEGKAEHLADQLVPFTLIGAALTFFLTRNTMKALTVLMVDFSCALKLAMPIAVLSAMQEAGLKNITVKGGKFLELVAEADTIVFDKTGTLTKAKPKVSKVVSFNGEKEEELLKIAACLEEHFPHSLAKAVVLAAQEQGIAHEEMHSKVEYIVAHGISSLIGNQKVVIGSSHFVLEDEGCTILEEKMDLFQQLPSNQTQLYLGINKILAAIICIEDPIRAEAEGVVNSLKRIGISKIVMMTGDSAKTAASVAKQIKIHDYYAEVLPEDKAKFVEQEIAKGRKVIMVGDGINDSPALSAASVGIAISDGAEIAREIADITIGADDLYEIVTLKFISDALMNRIHKTYRFVVGFNTILILLGLGGIISPTTSALLHNTSTLGVSLRNMQKLL